ncbi:hypothetical protein AKJ57_05520 [candidate division MSBL1 archaeon SCGC-AAA259A05]|uniref:Uncharacterized protein n=1 Tax=candidate division MSBL1 archaeon SCGC-AAA259A05 TaxID=1698259 RepID=A0A133U519_9EURY|nr:hypothetical protein AKJ57_05520 [candidate division MSBL1 archaeon SCGC-AAA259A05]
MVQTEIKKFQKAADEVVSFFKPRLRGDIRIKINTHTDPDGVAAGNILARCFLYYDVPFHISFGGPPEPKDLKKLAKRDYDLFVFLDQGTGQLQSIENYLLEADHEVLILDHHPGETHSRPGLTSLNPHCFGLNGARDVSASGVVYSVVRKFDERFKPLSEMALIGALGDRQETPNGFTGINRKIVEQAVEDGILTTREGLKLDRRTTPLVDCLSHSIRPFLLGLSGDEDAARELVEGMGLKPRAVLEELDVEKEEELRDEILDRIEVKLNKNLKQSLWGTIYTSRVNQAVGPKNLHEYVTMLDACEKLGKIEVGFSALLGHEDARDKAIQSLVRYQERMIETINWLASRKERIKATPRMRYIYVGEELDIKMMGEALSIALESGIIENDRPLIGLVDLSEDRLKASARAPKEFAEAGGNIGKVLEEVSIDLEGNGGGHDMAAAARIPREREDEFIKKVDQLLEEEN